MWSGIWQEKRQYVVALPLLCGRRRHGLQQQVWVNYFLPKRLRNFSTRPPMLSTDFWVPV